MGISKATATKPSVVWVRDQTVESSWVGLHGSDSGSTQNSGEDQFGQGQSVGDHSLADGV